MREIKFRAWCPENLSRTMLKWEEMETRHLNTNPEVYGILMQYTGIKDKNGKEIYEGDILMNPSREIVVVKWSSTEYQETWGHGECGIILFAGFKISSHNSKYEIIGNIYENPELLH